MSKIACCLILSLPIWSYTTPRIHDPCKGKVSVALENMISVDQSNQSVYYISRTWPSNIDSVFTSEVRLQVRDGFTHMQTEGLTLFKGPDLTIRVFHELQQINVTPGTSNQGNYDVNNFVPLLDSLIARSRVLECYEVCENDVNINITVLTPASTFQDYASVQKVTYSTVEDKLLKMMVEYKNRPGIKKLELEFIKWEKNNEPLEEMMLLKNPQELKKRYPGYTFKDLRSE
ncbi:MAG: hypothetical protein AAGF85_04340 [Bacteroidota bacterium]